jgi:transposase
MGGTGTLDIVAEERESLLRLACSASAEHRLVLRARLVWDRLVRGLSVSEVARMNGVERATVRSWEQRYREGGSLAALRDRKRTGRPPGFGMREQATVLGLSCQRPEDVGRIEACMTQEIIVEEAAKQSVVLSRSTVQRILASAEVKPYRERYYLFTVKDRPEFISRRDAICTAYTRLYPSDEVLVCIDEKTGIQALGLPHDRVFAHAGRRTPGRARDPHRLGQRSDPCVPGDEGVSLQRRGASLSRAVHAYACVLARPCRELLFPVQPPIPAREAVPQPRGA